MQEKLICKFCKESQRFSLPTEKLVPSPRQEVALHSRCSAGRETKLVRLSSLQACIESDAITMGSGRDVLGLANTNCNHFLKKEIRNVLHKTVKQDFYFN